MVKPSPGQQGILDELKRQKLAYNAEIEKREAELRVLKEVLKTPLRELISLAEEQNIPKRQVHLAMGFGQVNQLNNFLLDARETAGDRLRKILGGNAAELDPVGFAAQFSPAEREMMLVKRVEGKAIWDVTFPDGAEHMVYIIPEGQGHFYVDNPNQTVPVEKMRELFEYGVKNNKLWDFDDFGATYEEDSND